MSEYIKQSDAVTAIHQAAMNHKGITMEIAKTYDLARKAVEAIPAADVEPVVRCRDCEHSEEVDEESKTMFEGDPEFYCGHIDCPVDGNGFCSAGKRKAHMERSGSSE